MGDVTGTFNSVSTVALHIIELVKSLPLAEQKVICAALTEHTATKTFSRRKLQQEKDGSYYNPDGIPNDDPIFKVLEEIEQERHLTPGAPAPSFD